MTLCGENIDEQKKNWWGVIPKNRVVDGREKQCLNENNTAQCN